MTQVVSKAVGIDLGTTNSVVAMMDPTDTDVLIHRDRVSKSRTTPSCVWRDPANDELVVGRKAIIRVGNPPEPIRSIKRKMGQRTTVPLAGRDMTPEEVSAAILAEMKRQIEEDASALDTPDTSWIVDRAIVTVPAYFDQPQIDATRKAAEMAGLEVLDLLHEPTAAACYHCWRTGTENATFLVYDLGGGTFDVSVVRCTAGVYEVLGISGNNRLGGDDIDEALAAHLQEMLCAEGWALDLDLAGDPEDRLRFSTLKILAERVKKGLSEEPEYLLRDAGRLVDKQGNPVIIDTTIERADVDAITRPLIARTLSYCHEALAYAEEKAGVTLAGVDGVILAGGSTHMPLVREMVAAELCADGPAPLYEKVDTIVALGAAIRASVVGGLAVYDAERTVRVAFRGSAAANSAATHLGGTVGALDGTTDLTNCYVCLTTPDGETDESDLSKNGAFSFTRVPLRPGTETQLGFQIFDEDGTLRATVNRSMTHDADAARGLPVLGNPEVSSKAIILEVSRAGDTYRKTVVPALQELPTTVELDLSHPGDTDTVLFPLYQQSKKIQVITVPVPSSMPRGTPITFELHMDRHSFITVEGRVGDQPFAASVEPPPERGMPTDEAVAALTHEFHDALAYLTAGERNTAEIRWGMARDAFEQARRAGDTERAVHEFEEMEETVARINRNTSVLEPPKHEFDALVSDCVAINDSLVQLPGAAQAGHDRNDLAQSIEVQRSAGERAYQAGDQRLYGDAFRQLTGYLEHLRRIYESTRPAQLIPDSMQAQAAVEQALQEAATVVRVAGSLGRTAERDEAVGLQRQVQDLAGLVGSDARRVLEAIQPVLARLQQLMNLLTATSNADGGALSVDRSPDNR